MGEWSVLKTGPEIVHLLIVRKGSKNTPESRGLSTDFMEFSAKTS